MITGDAMLRSKDTKHPPKVTSFRCFGPNWQDSNGNQPPGGGTDTVELPNKPCGGGIRSNTNFPQYVRHIMRKTRANDFQVLGWCEHR